MTLSMQILLVLAQFAAAAGLVIWSGTRLCRTGEGLAQVFQWSHHWVGAILIAAATSLPELFTSVVGTTWVVRQPDLAFGNLVGSTLFNVLILAVFDLASRGRLIQGGIARDTAHSALLSVSLLLLVLAGLVFPRQGGVMNMGFYTSLLIPVYCVGVWLIFREDVGRTVQAGSVPAEAPPDTPDPAQLLKRFGFLTLVTFAASLWISYAAEALAEQTVLSRTFVGSIFLALVTSLPEVAVVYTAVRKGWYSLAVGALFGSNAFNVTVFALCDGVWPGSLLADMHPVSTTLALAALALTVIPFVRFMMRSNRQTRFVNPESLAVVAVYGATLFWLYTR